MWLSIHDYFLQNPDKWDNGVTYAELWQQYTTETQRTDRAYPLYLAALKEWNVWGKGRNPPLQVGNIVLTSGPARHVVRRSRATIGGVMYRAQYLDKKKDGTLLKSNNSYFLCRTANGDTDANGVEQWVYEVGRAQGFIQVSLPGMPGDKCPHELVVANWPVVPTPARTERTRLPIICVDRLV